MFDDSFEWDDYAWEAYDVEEREPPEQDELPRMDYDLPISLKSLALVKIATVILDSSNARIKAWKTCSELRDTQMYKKRKAWVAVEKIIINEASVLPLPLDLKTELAWYITGTSWELFLYLDFHRNKCKIISSPPHIVVWNQHGFINRRETELLLVNDTSLDIVERYKLACLNCLESDIVELWNQLHVGGNFRTTLLCKSLDTNPLISYWSHYVAGQLNQLHPVIMNWCSAEDYTHYEYAYRISADMHNEVAVRYFFGKLNFEEKEWLPFETIHLTKWSFPPSYLEKKNTAILYFLLQVFDTQQQSHLFSLNPRFAFSRFLDWPLQSLFIKVVQQWSSYLSLPEYHYLLKSISTRANMGCKDCNYQKIYEQLWNLTPPCFKRYIIENHLSEEFLLHLFDLGDWQNIALLLKEMSSAEKESFIFSEDGQMLCKRLIFNYHYEVLKYFILACISSRKRALKFRKLLMKWQSEQEDSGLSEDEYDYSEDDDILIPGEAYCLLGQAVEFMDDILIEKYKRRKDVDAHESSLKHTESPENYA